jgi:hypothetical protein
MKMSYDVHVSFHGLCGFVPSAPLHEGNRRQKIDWMGVMLANASEESRIRFNTRLDAHYPVVQYQLRDLAGQDPASDQVGFLNLRGVDLAILASETDSRDLTVDMTPVRSELPANDEEKRSFRWVTRIETLSAGSGTIDPDCLEENPLEDRVAARVHLTQGHLATQDLGTVGNTIIVSRLGNGKVRQAVARTVRLDLKDVEGEVRLRAVPFGSGVARDLVFKAPEPGRGLRFKIMNLCARELFSGGFGIGVCEDEDYRWNYILSKDNFETMDKPAPVPLKFTNPKNQGGGIVAAHCTPPQFESTLAVPPAVAAILQKILEGRP